MNGSPQQIFANLMKHKSTQSCPPHCQCLNHQNHQTLHTYSFLKQKQLRHCMLCLRASPHFSNSQHLHSLSSSGHQTNGLKNGPEQLQKLPQMAWMQTLRYAHSRLANCCQYHQATLVIGRWTVVLFQEILAIKQCTVYYSLQADLDLPMSLKQVLFEEHSTLRQEDRLPAPPHHPTVADILARYTEYSSNREPDSYASEVHCVLSSCWPAVHIHLRRLQVVSAVIQNCHLLMQMAAGIQDYFDKALPHMLLYDEELDEYKVCSSTLYSSKLMRHVLVCMCMCCHSTMTDILAQYTDHTVQHSA